MNMKLMSLREELARERELRAAAETELCARELIGEVAVYWHEWV